MGKEAKRPRKKKTTPKARNRKAKPSNTLNPRHERFCMEYVIDCNGNQAAVRAGYAPSNARITASKLLTNPNIKARIADLQQPISEKLEITAERVLRELALLGFANMADYIQVQKDGSAIIDLTTLTRDQAAAIQEITTEVYMEGTGKDAREVKRTRLKLANKRAALVDLGKHLKLFAGEELVPKELLLQIELVDSARDG